MKYIIAKTNEQFDEQRAFFTSNAQTEGGLIRAAKNALVAKFGEAAWTDIDICNVYYRFDCSPVRRFENQ